MDSSILVGRGYSEWILDKISKHGRTSASEERYNLRIYTSLNENVITVFSHLCPCKIGCQLM